MEGLPFVSIYLISENDDTIKGQSGFEGDYFIQSVVGKYIIGFEFMDFIYSDTLECQAGKLYNYRMSIDFINNIVKEKSIEQIELEDVDIIGIIRKYGCP